MLQTVRGYPLESERSSGSGDVAANGIVCHTPTLMMTMPALIWLILAVPVGTVWLFAHWALSYAARRRVILGPGSFDPPLAGHCSSRHWPKVSVLVAAKDEEANIESCITTLLDQDYPDYELIVIDDRSSDRTPAIIAGLADGAEDKLRVLRVDELPPGWFGKHHAMHLGARAGSGEWLCLVDADCRQVSRSTLSLAVRDALAHEADLLTLLPVLEMKSAWECALQPLCAGILLAWFPPHKVNKKRSRRAYANGMFMLISRKCYDAIGGHEGVRHVANEDMHMARRAKEAGYRIRVAENRNLFVTRMYRRMGEAWRGWSRIFCGCLESTGQFLGTASFLVVCSILPCLSLAAALAGWLWASDAGAPWGWMLSAWAAVVLLQQAAVWRLYRVFPAENAWSLAHPFVACILVGIMFNAMLHSTGARSITWRGTSYRVSVPAVSPGTRAHREPRGEQQDGRASKTV